MLIFNVRDDASVIFNFQNVDFLIGVSWIFLYSKYVPSLDQQCNFLKGNLPFGF